MSGVSEGVLTIDDDVWAQIVRPLGYDAGIRTLERTVEGVVRKVARLVVEGKLQSVKIAKENVKEYIPQ